MNHWISRREIKSSLIRFRSKFQEACHVNGPRWWMWQGYVRSCHCDCPGCTSNRQKNSLVRCTKENKCNFCKDKK